MPGPGTSEQPLLEIGSLGCSSLSWEEATVEKGVPPRGKEQALHNVETVPCLYKHMNAKNHLEATRSQQQGLV